MEEVSRSSIFTGNSRTRTPVAWCTAAVTAERVRREFRLFLTERSFRLAAACNETDVGAPKQIREWYAGTRTIGLHKNPATFERQIGRLALFERRAGRFRCDG